MADAAESSFPAPGGKQQRRLRNYLLDPQFQFKYTGYLVGITLLLGLGLGSVLWRTSEAVLEESHKAVEQGEQVVTRGREVLAESQKVSAVVQMNIVRDPDYSQNPALLEAFRADAEKQDARLAAQQRALEQQAEALKRQAHALTAQQRVTFFTLCGGFTLLVVLIGFMGIVVTHKVAGPVYKMKRHLREVANGRLQVPNRLRRGDELARASGAGDPGARPSHSDVGAEGGTRRARAAAEAARRNEGGARSASEHALDEPVATRGRPLSLERGGDVLDARNAVFEDDAGRIEAEPLGARVLRVAPLP